MRTGLTPVTRAACTYSLWRSTKVLPRTVRAYCTQPVKVMEAINTPKAKASCACGNKARPTPAMSSATKMAGKDSITSQVRMISASHLPPQKPAHSPRLTPSSTDSATELKPTNSEMRAPNISADKMSRPWSSVPSQYLGLPSALQAGGKRESASSRVARSNGLCGANQGAKTAATTQAKANNAATTAVGEWRKL